ncbi:nickel pincer cofactor-dependent isomerase, group 22 [Ornithinicoccus halotolerans]|uniref:DUF2088 domain-containing protein n=1 Tax=Ornithinicoccus halotolerans TaxID=1748220 RepID=UPI0012975559|nr:DUF2088 domain-containing protein [Ornithinicoccus halotolerans]
MSTPRLLDPVADLHVDLPDGASLPPWALVRRKARPEADVDVDGVVGPGIAALAESLGGLTGKRIAVGAGSRGIRDVATVVGATVRALQAVGAEPFIVPAMGSHGSSEAAGQAQVLADYGITEDTMGVPVVATIETIELGQTASGVTVRLDRAVSQGDGVILVNRVKPHTDFAGDFGSGLAKMSAIGLGNISGATLTHADGSAELPRVISEISQVMKDKGVLLGGVAIVEDELGRTAHVEVVPPAGIAGDQERQLLERARSLHGHLPFEDLDLLVVDEMGKNVSGAGMDTNVIGRFWVPRVPEPAGPHISAITVHSLTEESHGNASGLGLADVIPMRMAAQLDLRASWINALTSSTGGLRRSRTPMVLPTDRDVVHAAARMSGRRDLSALRMARVVNTLQLGKMMVSEPLLAELAGHDDLEVVGDPVPVEFTAEGGLPAWPEDPA